MISPVEEHRGRLFGIAYRMLGQVQEAEDLVQEAYLRWHQTDQSAVRTPLAWLVSVVTRLSIDRLRRLAAERVTYVGEWLPEPLALDAHWSADHTAGVRSDLSLAFLVLLERLAPEERAAFLLREVFDEDYAAIAAVLEKSEPAVRQIVHRARARVRTDRARMPVEPERSRRLLDGFLAALAADDKDALLSMFTDDATFTSDGGGKVSATIRIVVGRDRVARMFRGVEAKWGGHFDHRLGEVNGEPGILTYAEGRLFAVTAFEIVGGRIANVHRVMNPDKLGFADRGGAKTPPLPK
jgi:RNA polymerase sigma-70 factor, ECF subfamily